jgi:methanol--5-hydroxybenzimidazolylcobamide Co-methyltransferase
MKNNHKKYVLSGVDVKNKRINLKDALEFLNYTVDTLIEGENKMVFKNLAYQSADELVYGLSKNPVVLQNGLSIGGGKVIPEINFTLPTMSITKDTMPQVIEQYSGLMHDICKRAVELYVPEFVAEIEVLPPMTFNPEWGIEVTKVVRDIMYDYEHRYGIKSAVRITPVDIREDRATTHMWSGKNWENIMTLFEGAAKAGAELLAIESIGGKEVHDDATMFCDMRQAVFALGVLGCRDMTKLWRGIDDIAQKTGAVTAGDTACGFANTAMVLADRKFVTKSYAAVIRVMTAVRSLVAYEQGARGPHKDCGYEGVYVKAITGTPISMEGKTAACAHLSPVGNIAAAMADLWSNEAIQNIKLLGGMAPTVSFEQLVYDCRLMNEATKRGEATRLLMRDLLVDSDSYYDPQAYVLRPDVVMDISQEILSAEGHFGRVRKAAEVTIQVLKDAFKAGKVNIEDRELSILDGLQEQVASITNDELQFIEEMKDECDPVKFDPKKYDL